MLRVAVLVDNTLEHDRRALLELQTLSALPIDLTVYCNAMEGKPADDTLGNVRLKRVFTEAHWQFRNERLLAETAVTLATIGYDVLHCHDHFMLHIGALVKRRRPETILIYESRELFYSYPIHFFAGSLWSNIKSRLVRASWVRREKRNARTADFLITVNDSIAQLLSKRFGLKQPPVVTRNIGPLRIPQKNSALRDALQIPPHQRVVVYAGSNVYPNGIGMEAFVQQIANNPAYALVVIANNNARRKFFSEYLAAQNIRNVYVHDMVPVEQLEHYLAGCDIGLLTAWDKTNLSYWLALDNKLFTYIMAGLPVLATAQPEYEKVVNTYRVGVCARPEQPDAYRNGLMEVEVSYALFKANAERARHELNWQNEQRPLVDLYRRLSRSV